MFDHKTLANPDIFEVGPVGARSVQSAKDIRMPAGLKVVSADNHMEVTHDLFVERFPAALRDKAPRVWRDDFWRIGYPSPTPPTPQAERIKAFHSSRLLSEGFDLDTRYSYMDREGIDCEIVYPQSLIGFIRHPDVGVKEWVFRIYNEYMAEIGRERAGRFFGVGICSNWWDETKAEASVRQIVDLGLKTIMLPVRPGKTLDGKEITCGGTEMDRFWAAASEAGLPVSFHVGENVSWEGRGAFGTSVLTSLDPFRKPWGELVFGGVFDRHPNLQVIFAEAGISWVAPMLQDAELSFDTDNALYDPQIKHRPSHYWHNNCYATFMWDRLGLSLLDYIGADRVMWGSDYPHTEGTYGAGWDAMKQVIDATSEDKARAILGGNASRVYKLDS